MEVKVGSVLELFSFYEETLIKDKGVLLEVSAGRNSTGWDFKVKEKFLKAVWYGEKSFFFYLNGKSYKVNALIIDPLEKVLMCSSPRRTYDPRLRRISPRVMVGFPEKAQLFSLKTGKKLGRWEVRDISEKGIGLISKKRRPFLFLKREEEVVCSFSLRGREIKAKGVIRNLEEEGDYLKVGVLLTDLPLKDRNFIASFVVKRQREIAKTLS